MPERWQPDPALSLSRLNHPTISKDHPAFHEIPVHQQELVSALQDQFERWAHKLYFRHHLSDRLIAALNGYGFTAKLAACMMKSNPYTEGDTLGRCGLDWFCEFCAYLKGQDLLKKYAGAWMPGGWYEMVISLKTGVCPADPDHDTIREVHDAMVAILKRLQGRKLMAGYVAWLEIKVHQFYPYLIVTPHIHVLLRCDCPPDLRVFGMLIADEWIRRGLESWLDPWIKPVDTEAHFHEILDYIKPIDLYGPYERGHRAARADGKVELLHREVRLFFEALMGETTEFQWAEFDDACKRALKKTLPKSEWKPIRKRWDEILAQIVGKPVTIPLSKVIAKAITKTLDFKLSRALRNKISEASMIVLRRKLKLVTRRRFLYGGNCHGCAGEPIGLAVEVRRTPEHQEAIREAVALAREAEERCRQADEQQPEG